MECHGMWSTMMPFHQLSICKHHITRPLLLRMGVTVSVLGSGFSPRTPREAIATACEQPCLRVAQKETRRDRTFHDPRLYARTSPAHVEKRTWTFRSPCPCVQRDCGCFVSVSPSGDCTFGYRVGSH